MRTHAVSVIAALVASVSILAIQGQGSKSAAGAKQLAQLLADKKIDTIAAQHPGGPDIFVAALHFPGQLLVVWARYSAPALLNEKIVRGEYRDVYIDLNSASIADTRVFITDLGADGLTAQREGGSAFDRHDAGGRAIHFSGNWRENKLSEQEYMRIYIEADHAYAQALEALIAQLKKSS